MIDVIHTGPYGVNTFIVSLEGPYVFITDPACCSFCGDEDSVTEYLSENKLIPVAVVLTHGHYDHVAGLSVIKKAFPDIPVLIHSKDAHCIGAEGYEFQKKDLECAGFGYFSPALENLPEADGFLEEGKSLYDAVKESSCCDVSLCPENLKNWKVLHTPGHTQGCVCLYNAAEKNVITGDTVFYHSWGRTDLEGGSESEMASSLRRFYSEVPGDVKVYPGHEYYGFTVSDNLQ